MKELVYIISEEMKKAFEKAGYDRENGMVKLSDRPDLCEFQCNGAMALARSAHKAPIMIAEEIAALCADSDIFESVNAVKPGFLNINVKKSFISSYVSEMSSSDKCGFEEAEKKEKVIIDYGGPNVAKPLHVGHLRSAVIGESIKRIFKFNGHDVIGDIHMGDWGLQMGLIIAELKERKPDLPYFDESFTGEYPKEAPFTIAELEEIYPTASAKSKPKKKEDESEEAFLEKKKEGEIFKDKAMEATKFLQDGVRGYRALWDHIINVSVSDLKRNYERLNVSFELWNGESSVHDVIPGMVSDMKASGLAYESEGALVVDVKEESDQREVPPCMILKSDGASLYNTTDLATIKERVREYDPDRIIYVVDKRQELYFTQVFRCAKKTGLVNDKTLLKFLGFGTVNGSDGTPFKTRDGGVMRLEFLLDDIEENMYKKITENHDADEAEAKRTAAIVALSAVKYGDLSNQPSKDYIFDTDRFTSFEGDTGPYILYTIVRINSILAKYKEASSKEDLSSLMFNEPESNEEKALMLSVASFSENMRKACEDYAPNRICAYVYDLSNAFNRFYHEVKVLGETDEKKKEGYIALLSLCKKVMETCIDVLGFSAPDRM